MWFSPCKWVIHIYLPGNNWCQLQNIAIPSLNMTFIGAAVVYICYMFFPHGRGAHKQAPCTTLTLPHHPQLPPPLHIIYNLYIIGTITNLCTLAQHVPITLLLYILYSIVFYSISYILLFFILLFYVQCTNDTKAISCMCKHTWQIKEFWFWFWRDAVEWKAHALTHFLSSLHFQVYSCLILWISCFYGL